MGGTLMYVFRLWFAGERAIVAKEKMDRERERCLANLRVSAEFLLLPQSRQEEVIAFAHERFDLAEQWTARNIHPLRVLFNIKTPMPAYIPPLDGVNHAH